MGASNKKLTIVVLGTGNVGYHLARQILSSGQNLLQVYSRSLKSAKSVGEELEVPFTNDLEEINPDADIYLLAIRDDAIATLSNFRIESGIVAHTSGTVSAGELAVYAKKYGVFYPLQTFKKETRIDFSGIPILIDGVDDETKERLAYLGQEMSGIVHHVSEKDRKTIHLAAVLANNFSNHLWHLSEDILKARSLSFDVLIPLIENSVNQLKTKLPSTLQTGPAVRGDSKTMQEHLQALQDHPRWQQLYDLLSLSIQESQHSED